MKWVMYTQLVHFYSKVHNVCLSVISLRRQVKSKEKERSLYWTNIIKKKGSCYDNDHADDAIVIITLDQNVIFHFLTYTLMD
jgi:hypothetical protein